jgi:hypothetical protein
MIGFSERKVVAPRSVFLQYTDGVAKNVTGITGAAEQFNITPARRSKIAVTKLSEK